MKLFELFAELSLDSSNFDRGIRGASAAGESFAHKLGGGVKSTTIALGNLMSQAVTKGAALLKQFASIGLGYNRQMETYNMNFRTLLGGSSEAASAMTEELRSMAAATPFAMSDLAGATQTLLSFGVESESVVSTLQMLGDISLGNAQNMSSLALVFGQVSSAGKLMGQDLMQFINAGFNPLLTISEKTGLSMTELKDFMSSGKMSSAMRREVRKAQREVAQMGDQASDAAKMLAQMGEDGVISAELLAQVFSIETSPGGRFYQAMASASQTTEGMLSTLEDNANTLLGNILQPTAKFISEKILPAAIKMTDRLNAAYDEGGLAGLWAEAQEIGSELMATLGQSAIDTGANLLANLYTSLTGDTTSAEAVKAYIGGLWTDAQTAVSDFVGAGSSALSAIYTAITGQEATAANIAATLGGIFNAGTTAASELISVASTLLADIADHLETDELGNRDTVTEMLAGLFEAGTDAATGLVDAAGNLLGNIYHALTGDAATAKKISDFVSQLFGKRVEDTEQGRAIAEFAATLTADGNVLTGSEKSSTALSGATKFAEAVIGTGLSKSAFMRTVTEAAESLATSNAAFVPDDKPGWSLLKGRNALGEMNRYTAGNRMTVLARDRRVNASMLYTEQKAAVNAYTDVESGLSDKMDALREEMRTQTSRLVDAFAKIGINIDGVAITNVINANTSRKANNSRYTK